MAKEDVANTDPNAKHGVIGRLQKFGSSVKTFFTKKRNTKGVQTRMCKKEEREMVALTDKFAELRQERSAQLQELQELQAANKELLKSIDELKPQVACIDKTVNHRYRYVETYLPKARQELSEERKLNQAIKEKLAVQYNCPVDRVEEVIESPPCMSTQTCGPFEAHAEKSKTCAEKALQNHMAMVENHLMTLEELVAQKKKDIKELREKQKRQEFVRANCGQQALNDLRNVSRPRTPENKLTAVSVA